MQLSFVTPIAPTIYKVFVPAQVHRHLFDVVVCFRKSWFAFRISNLWLDRRLSHPGASLCSLIPVEKDGKNDGNTCRIRMTKGNLPLLDTTLDPLASSANMPLSLAPPQIHYILCKKTVLSVWGGLLSESSYCLIP